MDLPVNDEELATIIRAMALGGDTALYQKLKIVKETRDAHPGGPYKQIIREQYGMSIWLMLIYLKLKEVYDGLP